MSINKRSDRVIVGAQWGDEGKGKIIDMLSPDYDVIARYHGGANAGHTLVINNVKTVLHQIPSGIMTPHKICVIGNGCVVDPTELVNEISMLKADGIDVGPHRLHISIAAPIVLRCHMALDRARDFSQKIGTTGRGIGPAYEDLANRSAVRMGDLRDRYLLAQKINRILAERNMLLSGYGAERINIDDELYYLDRCMELIPYLLDISSSLANKAVLFEGAQGAMLDVHHGTHPYVTSSSTIAASAALGTGISHQRLENVLGVTKAYTTRVGSGPFPTEQDNDIGIMIRTRGGEFGATTGRPRRCGWLDLPVLRYSARINGIREFAVTKLDVLKNLEEVKVCTHYIHTKTSQMYNEFPCDPHILNNIVPVYTTYQGFDIDLDRDMTLHDLPTTCQNIIHDIGQVAPVSIVSIGPGRDQYLRGSTCHPK